MDDKKMQSFGVKNKPKYKKQEFFSFQTVADQAIGINVNSEQPIDRIRITVAGQVIQDIINTYGLLVYCDIVNSCVGSIIKDFSTINIAQTDAIFSDSLDSGDGMDFFYPNKVLLQGYYPIKLTELDGTLFNSSFVDIFILIEYFED